MGRSPQLVGTVDEYIACFPMGIQTILQQLRQTIRKVVPQAQECISYQLPTYKCQGVVAHFGAHSNHIALYPTPTAIEAFREELSSYQTSKGTIKFALNRPIPYDLIARIVEYKLNENRAKVRPHAKDSN